MESNFSLISLDVVSLFTNVSTDLAVDSIEKRWELISTSTSISLEEFIKAVRMILNFTFFSFNNVFYEQIFDTPMGAPLSPIIADLVMQDLEESALKLLPWKLPAYYRYVNDIFLIAPTASLNMISTNFNSLHTQLQFTMEIERNCKFSFLDVMVINDLYHKPSFSGRYLNFNSHYLPPPMYHKRGVIFSLLDKIVLLSHSQFYQKNFTETYNVAKKWLPP